MERIEVFSLYSNLSEPEVWKFWEDQIKLAVAAAYVRARAAAQKEPLLPLEIVGELSVTLRQGDEVIRVDLPRPSLSKSLPTPKEASPATPKKAKQYFIPPVPEWAKVKDGNFLIWFGKQHKLKWLKNLRDPDELTYCDWMVSQEALSLEHREAVKNHVQSVLDEDDPEDVWHWV